MSFIRWAVVHDHSWEPPDLQEKTDEQRKDDVKMVSDQKAFASDCRLNRPGVQPEREYRTSRALRFAIAAKMYGCVCRIMGVIPDSSGREYLIDMANLGLRSSTRPTVCFFSAGPPSA